MGTVVARPRKNNAAAYIVRKSGGVVIYRETATFDRRAAARYLQHGSGSRFTSMDGKGSRWGQAASAFLVLIGTEREL